MVNVNQQKRNRDDLVIVATSWSCFREALMFAECLS